MVTQVPLLDVNAQNLPLKKDLTAAFERVLESGRFIGGAEVEALEREAARLLDVAHAVSLSSGTDALLAALVALGIGPGDEVLVPTFTFFATAGCVARLGATPVFVDVCPVCFNLDADRAAEKLTDKTKAIIPVHLFGQAADMDSIMDLAEDHDLRVLEDCAQAIGAKYRGKTCGAIGHCGALSFFPSKNLGGFGDAGLFVTNDPDLAREVTHLRNHGMDPKYYHSKIGGNFRCDALQAAMLRVKLPLTEQYSRLRQENAEYYTRQMWDHPLIQPASPENCCCPINAGHDDEEDKRGIILPVAYPHNVHVWNQYTLRVLGEGRRDALKAHLTERGIGCEIYYPLPLDQQECFANLPEFARDHTPNATQLAREVLSIPIYPELTREQKDAVIDGIFAFYEDAVGD